MNTSFRALYTRQSSYRLQNDLRLVASKSCPETCRQDGQFSQKKVRVKEKNAIIIKI
jgi:hypothetical protein